MVTTLAEPALTENTLVNRSLSLDSMAPAAPPSSTASSPAEAAPSSAPTANAPGDRRVEDLALVFKLLSDETRLRVLGFLGSHHELHVRALCECLHQSQPAVSHHLALLREAGLIACRREGKHNFYRLLPDRFHHLVDTAIARLPGGAASQ